MSKAGTLAEAGGAAYLAKIVEAAPLAVNAPHYAKIVAEKARLRRQFELVNEFTRAAMDGGDVAEIRRRLLDGFTEQVNGGAVGFKLLKAGDLELRPIEWLIPGWIERDALVLAYGDSAVGKSFLVGDMAFSRVTGAPWHGRPVGPPEPVVVICGEGWRGWARRAKAWSIRHRAELKDAPLFISNAAAGLSDPEQLRTVRKAIDGVVKQHGNPGLVIIDTLARCFGPGDENSTRDMSAFIVALDELRAAYDCTIIVVHHVGHGAKDRARGAAALRAALDAEFRVERGQDGIIRLTATKMKDAALPEPIAFETRVVELGIEDEDGQPATSLCLHEIPYEPPTDATLSQPRGKWQRLALEVLSELQDRAAANLEAAGFSADGARVSVDQWRSECQNQGIRHRSTWARVTEALNEQGAVRMDKGYVTMP